MRVGAIPGHEFSRTIVAVGANIDAGEIGGDVYGFNDWLDWFADGGTLEEANGCYSDTPSEADINVRTPRALAGMVDAVIEQPATFLVPVA